MRNISITFLMVTVLTVWGAAQALPAATGGGISDTTGQASASSPAPITGQGGSLEYTSELGRSNYFRGGLAFTTAFDDNVLNTDTDPISDVSYSILPHFALDQSRGRLKWTLDYAGGVTIYQRITSRNQGSHSAGFETEYRISPHVTFRLNDRFDDTTTFFSADNNNFTSPAGGVLQSPNSFVITPLARELGNFTQAETDYQVGAGTIVGGSGSYYFSRYSDVTNGAANTSSLLDTKSEQAQGFITHRITPRNWSGLTYRFQRLTFGSGDNETIAHSILYFHTIYLQPSMTLSLFAGPEYTDVSSRVVSQVIQLPLILVISTPVAHQSWSASGGATFAWQGLHTSAQASFVRRTTDGGGVLGAVRTNTVDATLRRQISRSSSILGGFTYGTNDSIDFLSTPGSSIRVASGRLGFERRLGNNLFASVGYSRDHQVESATNVPSGNIDHNRAWITIAYDFSRPLGR